MKNLLIIGYGGAGKRYEKHIKYYFKNYKINILSNQEINNKDINVINQLYDAINLNPEGVFVANPTSRHLELASKFVNIAKFILIEKPMDKDLYKCEVFRRNFKDSETNIYINYQRRYLDCWQKLKEEIENCNKEFRYGIIKINSYMPSWRENYRQIYAANKELGGGALLTECHEIDIIQWIFGKIVSVNSSIIQTKNFELDVEDAYHVILNINTKNGVKPITLLVDFMSDKIERRAEFIFDDIRYEIYEDNNELRVYEDKKMRKVDTEEIDPNKKLIKNIYSVEINNEKDIEIPNINDGVRVNAVIDAIKRSYITKKEEPVNESTFPMEGAKYIEYLVDRAKEKFGDKIIAIYGMGSLGYGGYVEGWSDFDIDIILKDIDYEEAKNKFYIGKEIEKEIIEKGFERIDIRTYSIEHLNKRKTILNYGQCSRASMLCDSARLIYGEDIRHMVKKPSIKDMNEEAKALLNVMLKRTEKEWKETPWDDIAAFFALNARFLYSKDNGTVSGKKKALVFFLDNYSNQYSEGVLQWTIWALACRNHYDQRYIQERLHKNAIENLKQALLKTKKILEEE